MRDLTNEQAFLDSNALAALGPATSREALAEIADLRAEVERLQGQLAAWVKVLSKVGVQEAAAPSRPAPADGAQRCLICGRTLVGEPGREKCEACG